MLRNTLRVFIGLCVVLMATLPAVSQATKDGVISINGGRNTVFVGPHTQDAVSAIEPAAGLVTIYSTLGHGNNAYNASSGSGLLGRDTGMMWPEWLACGFTATADHTVSEIIVGVSHVTGADPILLSLNDDAGGVPGNVLHVWQFAGLPDFGTCCAVQTGKVKPGIPIKGGKTYWVTIRTLRSNPDTYDVWNNDFKGEQGAFANNLGSGWINEGIQQLGAFGVFGQ